MCMCQRSHGWVGGLGCQGRPHGKGEGRCGDDEARLEVHVLFYEETTHHYLRAQARPRLQAVVEGVTYHAGACEHIRVCQHAQHTLMVVGAVQCWAK